MKSFLNSSSCGFVDEIFIRLRRLVCSGSGGAGLITQNCGNFRAGA
jgi:hypothetical protein